jgi:hypothetical protein
MTYLTGVLSLKKLSQLALLIALFLGISSQSEAALLIEPVVGYNLGYKMENKLGGTKDSYTGGAGASFGGRLGYQNFGLQLGVDYLKSSIDMNDNDFGGNFDTSEWAGFIGYEFPLMLRVYAGYIFSGTASSKDSSDDSYDLSGGTGTKIGVGFTGLPFIDINLEYRTATFNEIDATGVPSSIDFESTYSTIMLGLSVPFTL